MYSTPPIISLPIVIFFIVSIYSSEVLALSPYPPESPPKTTQSSETSVTSTIESCDSPCYHNKPTVSKESQQNTLLCGSDGFTYLNFEELYCVRKSCGKDIRLKKIGRCPRISSLSSSISPTTPASLPPPPPEPKAIKEHPTGSPVTSRRFDTNFLRFLSQETVLPVVPEQPLIFSEVPKAPENANNRRFNYFWKTKPIPKKPKTICLQAECECPEIIFDPVCGSDSITYGNKCLMNCARECKPDLIKYHDGYCGKGYRGRSCEINECNCPEEEYDDDGLQLRQPVCGNDGITYGSLCLLECNKNCKPELRINYNGYCGRLIYPQEFK